MSEISYVSSLYRKFGGIEIYYVGTDFEKANQVLEAYSLDYEEDCFVLEVWSEDLKLMVYRADEDRVWYVDFDVRSDVRFGKLRAEEELEKLRKSLAYWEESLKETTEKCDLLDDLIKRIPITESEEV